MSNHPADDNYYNLLGLKHNVSLSEIKARFRDLAKQFHPDRYFHPSQKIWATRKFQKLVEAYETLSSPEKRKEYDENLHIKNIKIEEMYSEKIPKSIFYFWWWRFYVYLIPLFFYFLMRGNLSLALIEDLGVGIIALYAFFFVLLPWILLSIFPPFWFTVSSRYTKNMGGLAIMFFIIGSMIGIGGVMSFIFNPGEYEEILKHLPIRREFVIFFYVAFIIVFLSFSLGDTKIKENVFLYPALAFGLIISIICVIYSFRNSIWISFFIFAFYIAACLDFLISSISYERIKSKFYKKRHNAGIKMLLTEK